MILPIPTVPFDKAVQNLCSQPFKAHPGGCPNFGTNPNCPPRQKLINELLDLREQSYIIITTFHYSEYTKPFTNLPKRWYERKNWEPLAKQQHEKDLAAFSRTHPGLTIIRCPEAFGVNVAEIMEQQGLPLKWTYPPLPEDTTLVISLAGSKRTEERARQLQGQ